MTDIGDPIKWFEEAITKKHIRYYEYEHFNGIEEIGSGGFGKVYRAKWKSSEQYLALKSFNILNKATANEIANELIQQRVVDFHDNIIRFIGVTLENTLSKNYSLVMEYADSGTLRKYLKKNFDKLTWKHKYDMAYQLACAVSCLHNEDIVHRDLHSKNILVHRGTIKLADFGLSRKIEESSNNKQSTLLFGMAPYVDPQKFNKQTYKLNKKSDIYSIGILLWEISSGKIPFCGQSYDIGLIYQITSNGLRETPVPDTPKAYVKLYTDCWDADPNKRPNINDVIDRLKNIKLANTYGRSIHEQDLDISSSNEFGNSFIQERNLNISSSIGTFSNTTSNDYFNTRELMGFFNQPNVDEMVDFINKNLKEGNNLEKNTKNMINSYCENNQINLKEICKFLSSQNNDAKSNFLFGILNFLGIGTDINKQKAIKLCQKATKLGYDITQYNDELFKKAVEEEYHSEEEIPIPIKVNNNNNNRGIVNNKKPVLNSEDKYHLALTYLNGINVEKDDNMAFKLFKESAEDGHLNGMNMLGECYFYGTGTTVNTEKALELYQEASNKKNSAAQYNLALMYKDGIIVEKDHEKAFELFKESAERGYLNALSLLEKNNDGFDDEYKQKADKLYQRAKELGAKFDKIDIGKIQEKYKYNEGILNNLRSNNIIK